MDGRWMALQVWVAGGVGVTPFLAWLQAAWQPLTVPVDFYTVCAMRRSCRAGRNTHGMPSAGYPSACAGE
jgi:hypothetical protein